MSPIDYESSNYCGHSADVRITLFLDGDAIPVAQLGPGFLLLDDPSDHPPSDARIVLRVDQSERSWPVRLPEGISAECERVLIAAG
jgi:hypothetical protein